MHYENGHEVAQQLAREVHSIAFSQTKAWTRRESPEETYICQVGGMIALKLHAMFDCSPDTISLFSPQAPFTTLTCSPHLLLPLYVFYALNAFDTHTRVTYKDTVLLKPPLPMSKFDAYTP
jgi:hypothetical protein